MKTDQDYWNDVHEYFPVLGNLFAALRQRILAEADLPVWAWEGSSRHSYETPRHFIARGIEDIYFVPGSDSRSCRIYPAACGATEETLRLIEQINEVKGCLEEALVNLRQFGAGKQRLDRQALRSAGMADVHRLQLYRRLHFSRERIRHIGFYWGQSPKVVPLTVSEARTKLARLPSDEERRMALYNLESLPEDTELAQIELIQTSAKLHYHYLGEVEQNGELVTEQIVVQIPAVMPFFFLARPNQEPSITHLPSVPCHHRRKKSRARTSLYPVPLVNHDQLQIYQYRPKLPAESARPTPAAARFDG